uniref:Interleukin-17C-like n=1 Tax=Scleropages formosus TaxID=113540 RepID=A0A8C9RLF1_SCLFO
SDWKGKDGVKLLFPFPPGEAAMKHKACLSKSELGLQGQKFLRKHLQRSGWFLVQTPLTLYKSEEKRTCAGFTPQSASPEHRNRALSPWKYRIDVDENRYPQEIAVAECLCEGCIINGQENLTFNSEPVKQTIMVSRYEKCPEDPQKFSLVMEPMEIEVACTCVIPRTSH